MNEVEIPLKVTGIGAMKAELRELKGAIANATDPAEFERLTQQAGQLTDKIKDTNTAIKDMATGSKFESLGNQFGSLKDSLMSLDFEEASERASVFARNLGTLNAADIGKSITGLGKTIGILGQAFVKLGVQILMNPIFLLVAVITAIVAAVLVFLNKIGVLQKILDFLMVPIKALIDGFKSLTDWLGLTSFAAEDNAQRMMKANEQISESSKKRTERLNAQYDHEINMAKIAGKDTTDLELKKSKEIDKEAKRRKEAAKDALRALRKLDDEDNNQKIKDLRKQIDEENKIIREGRYKRKEIRAQEKADEAASEKKANDEAAALAQAAYEKAKERAKTNAANRLKAARELRDFELSQIKDTNEREIALVNEKYKRLAEDLKVDQSKTAEEKAKYTAMYLAQQEQELNTINDARIKTEQDNLKKGNELIADLQLQLMEEGTAKELAMTKAKYNKLREAVLNDITLTEQQRLDLISLYNQQEEAENQRRIDAANKQQADRLKQLNDEALGAKDALALKLQQLQEAYDAELLLAQNNEELKKALRERYDSDKLQAEQTASKTSIDEAQKERDAKLQLASDVVNGVTALGNAFIKDQKKLAKFNKAAALIQIGIDTAKAISSLVSASQSNPLNGVTFGAAGIAQFASGIIQIATNIAKAKQLLSSGGTGSISGGGGSAGGGEGGSANVATQVPASTQLFGAPNQGNVVSAGGGNANNNMTVTAVVSETQITNVQNKITKINKNAEL
jgi:hypothetical protein